MAEVPMEQRKVMAGALMQAGHSERIAAEKAGISPATAHRVKTDATLMNSPEVKQLRENIGAQLLAKAGTAMSYLTPDKLEQSSADQLARITDILHKAYRRETGQATEVVSITAGLARSLDERE